VPIACPNFFEAYEAGSLISEYPVDGLLSPKSRERSCRRAAVAGATLATPNRAKIFDFLHLYQTLEKWASVQHPAFILPTRFPEDPI